MALLFGDRQVESRRRLLLCRTCRRPDLVCGRGSALEFDGRRWSVLRRGVERINDLLRTRNGNIWVASNNGLLRYAPQPRDAWVESGLDDGLPSTTVRDLFEDERGLWAATSRGLSLFH